jgi:hypothetical protein
MKYFTQTFTKIHTRLTAEEAKRPARTVDVNKNLDLFFFSGQRQPSLYPPEPELRATVDRILFFDIGTLYKSLVDYFVSSTVLSLISPKFSFF